MSLFSCDDAFVTFGATPVSNQFILEYLPKAKGDHVRVYLYGLMKCLYPCDDDSLNIQQMAGELQMTENEVLAAYRHWERCGLVIRVSDNPVAFRYVSALQAGCASPVLTVDEEYIRFSEDLYAAFNNERQLEGSEISLCYEWVTDLGLSPEVVMMLVKHMISIRGKNFSVKSAEKTALALAEQGGTTLDTAEKILARDKSVRDGAKKILLRMGKHRLPSEDELDLYAKWTDVWGLSHRVIEEACAGMLSGDPNFAYLSAILERKRGEDGEGKALTEGERRRKNEEDDALRNGLKELLRLMNSRTTVNEATLTSYREMLSIYPRDVILLAGEECARNGGSMDDVGKLLTSWKKRGLTDCTAIRGYITHFRQQSQRMAELHDIWGTRDRVTQADRALLDKWLDEWKISWELVLTCAVWAASAERPMAYLDKLLSVMKENGVKNSDEAKKFHEANQGKEKKTPGQNGRNTERQYVQRQVTEEIATADDLVARWRKEHPDA